MGVARHGGGQGSRHRRRSPLGDLVRAQIDRQRRRRRGHDRDAGRGGRQVERLVGVVHRNGHGVRRARPVGRLRLVMMRQARERCHPAQQTDLRRGRAVAPVDGHIVEVVGILGRLKLARERHGAAGGDRLRGEAKREPRRWNVVDLGIELAAADRGRESLAVGQGRRHRVQALARLDRARCRVNMRCCERMSRLVDRGRCGCAAVAPVDRHRVDLAGGRGPGVGVGERAADGDGLVDAHDRRRRGVGQIVRWRQRDLTRIDRRRCGHNRHRHPTRGRVAIAVEDRKRDVIRPRRGEDVREMYVPVASGVYSS